jgi:soluble lytic murein transglycosylase-like protein
MGRDTQRRLAALALIAVGSAAAATLVPSTSARTPVRPSAFPLPELASATVRPPGLCPFPAELRPGFEAAARDTNLPPALLYAVAKVESNLRQDVTSESGAHGLLQLLPATGAMLALDIDEPHSNVLAGARYLRQMMRRFGSADLALAAYNAGPTAVARAGGAPDGAVVSYVANVTALWRSVAGCR